MLARYEEFEEFIEAITEEHKKNKELPVYISILRTQDEESKLTTQMYIQVVSSDNNNLVLTLCYTDLPAITVVSPATFVSAFGENENSAAAIKKYEADFLQTTTKILAEKEKLIKKLKELGFTKFVNAILQ